MIRVRELLAQVPGVELLGFEQPHDIWTRNWRGWEIFSCPQFEPGSSQVIDWVEAICRQESIEGAYYFLFIFYPLSPPRPYSGSVWVQVRLDSTYAWVEPLWDLTKEDLNFIAVDETYRLEISNEEWNHYARRKRRSGSKSYPEYLDITLAGLTRIKRLGDEYIISGDSEGDAQVWRSKDKKIVSFLEGYSEHADAVRISDCEAVSNPFLYGGSLHLWNFLTGEVYQKTKRYLGVPSICWFVPIDETHVVTSFFEGLRELALWDIRTGEVATLFGQGSLGSFVTELIKIDDEHVAVGLEEGDLQIWNFPKRELVNSLSGHGARVSGLLKTGEGVILSCSQDGILRSWDVAAGESHQLLKLDQPPVTLAELDPGVLTISGEPTPAQEPGRLDWWNLRTSELVASVLIPKTIDHIRGLEILGDRTIIVQCFDAVHVVEVISNSDGQPSLVLKGPDQTNRNAS